MKVHLNANCLGSLHRIAIRADESPTWGWFASEAIRLALMQLERKSPLNLIDLLSSLRLLNVSSCQFGILSFGDEITSDWVSKIGSSTINVIVEGPLPSLTEKLLIYIARFYTDKARHIAVLSLLNRKFRAIFEADAIWKDIEIKYKWSGGGVDGTEQQEWNSYRIESGLPYFNTER